MTPENTMQVVLDAARSVAEAAVYCDEETEDVPKAEMEALRRALDDHRKFGPVMDTTRWDAFFCATLTGVLSASSVRWENEGRPIKTVFDFVKLARCFADEACKQAPKASARAENEAQSCSHFGLHGGEQ